MRLFVLLAMTAISVPVRAEEGKPVAALGGLDPVDLVNGKEVVGKEGISITHYRYLYQFASMENKQAFAKSPEQYKIQLGGACARMGPLSGSGNPGRFVVHDRKIYIFASEQCKTAFLKAPPLFLPQSEPKPAVKPDAVRRANELFAKAIENLGGNEPFGRLKSLQIETTIAYKQGDAVTEGKRTRSIDFTGRYRQEEVWGASRYGDAVTPVSGFHFDSKSNWEMEPEVRDYFRQSISRDPLVLLKGRGEKDFLAMASGKQKLGDTEAELVTIHWRDSITLLAIDPATGRILQGRFPTRTAAGHAELTRTYSDFRKVDGLVLPYTWVDSIGGKAISNPTVRVDVIRMNPKLDDKLFAR